MPAVGDVSMVIVPIKSRPLHHEKGGFFVSDEGQRA